MTIETDFFSHLDGQTLTGTPTIVYGLADPDVTLPYVTLTTIALDRERTTTVTSAVKNVEIEVECWAATNVSAITIANEIVAVYEDFTGAVGSFNVQAVHIRNEYSSNDSAAEAFARTFTLTLTYK